MCDRSGVNTNQTTSHADLCFVALGSNLGDSRQNLRQAIERLQAFSDGPLLRSSLWLTTPVDCPPGSPSFINGVVGLVTRADETPETMLAKLKAMEREFGRASKTTLNEPRPLDLDLITFGKHQRDTPELILPHPRAHQRRFVRNESGHRSKSAVADFKRAGNRDGQAGGR